MPGFFFLYDPFWLIFHGFGQSKRLGNLINERKAELDELGFDWKIPGHTLEETSDLLSEKTFARKSGFHSIAKYRREKLIKPVGTGSATGSLGLTYFYHPKQIDELKKALGITLSDTKGLIGKSQVIKNFKLSHDPTPEK